MTINLKYLLTTVLVLLFFANTKNKENKTETQPSHNVEKLINMTQKDIINLESKVDSILASNINF